MAKRIPTVARPRPRLVLIAAGALAISLSLAAQGGRSAPAPAPAADRSPVSVVKSLYAAFEAGDLAKVRGLIAEDATWTYYGPSYALPFAGTRKGPAGVDDFFAKVEATLSGAAPGQREFIASGDSVAVPGTEESTVKATGERYKVNNLHLFKVRNGQIYAFEEYIDSGAVMEAFASPDTRLGRAYFTACAGCHGNAAQGRPEMFAPNLTGQAPEYLLRQLRNFRADARGVISDPHGFQMNGRAKALPGDRGARDVVAYIANLPVSSPKVQKGGAGSATRGKALYEPCAACHGANAEGSAQTLAPRLAGLDQPYIVASIGKYRSGIRGFAPSDAPGATMAASAKSLKPAEVEDVAAYIVSLRKR